jgi:hypothetical protein
LKAVYNYILINLLKYGLEESSLLISGFKTAFLYEIQNRFLLLTANLTIKQVSYAKQSLFAV